MPTSMVKLAEVAVTSNVTQIQFTGYSMSYKDLMIIGTPIQNSSNDTYLRVNNDSGANYNRVQIWENGSSVNGQAYSANSYWQMGQSAWMTSNPNCIQIVHLFDYGKPYYKSMIFRISEGTKATEYANGRWMSTSSITSISFYGTTFLPGTKYVLYGIAS